MSDYLRLARRTGCFELNDARGHFDRIFYTVVILVFMSFGVPAMIARTLFGALQKARHRIKTGFGISELVYGDEEIPIRGSG